MRNIEHVVIVGGGTSGWLTAAILAKKFLSIPGCEKTVTLIESPDVPTIGVGEGTFPTMLETLKYIGIEEKKFVDNCQATFKQAIKFVDWRLKPKNNEHESYYHLFNSPAKANGIDLVNEWIGLKGAKPKFAHAVNAQAYICDANLSPKLHSSDPYRGNAKYAYHLDAAAFGKLLKTHAKEKLNVQHISATIKYVSTDADGYISELKDNDGQIYSGDLFVDCTGFASLLIGKTLKSEFIDMSDVLFVDRALAIQVPNQTEQSEIASHTISSAQSNGWTWDIGLQKRRGIGYVYSSRHSSEADAEKTIRNYIGTAGDNLDIKSLAMRVGYRKESWVKNCVAIGFSSGFMEPLEATAIAMVETAALNLASQFPDNYAALDSVRTKFNHIFSTRWQKIAEFIKLHYCLSERQDSQFWLDNCDPSSIQPDLKEKIEMWRHFPPSENDFSSRWEMFSLSSYQYILYGMGFETRLPSSIQTRTDQNIAKRAFAAVESQGNEAQQSLPSHREIIESLCR